MKKFLDELNKYTSYLYDDVPKNTDAGRRFQELRNKYSKLIGKRALYMSRPNKESRVVVIEEARPRYVRVSYKYVGMTYKGVTSTCIQYQSLICGESRLDVE